ncbi:MAG: hypothetical protein PHQ19_08970 [Candidatus Krumholzibacteria bacterium]|nr:hypothetical protein [Candidatus Krumholzibacteria bacterium]
MADEQREAGSGGGMRGADDLQGRSSAAPDGVIGHLVAASGWMRLMSVLGFIGVGLMGLAGLVILSVGFPDLGAGGRLIGLVYIVFAVIYLICVLPLNRAAQAAGRLRISPQEALAAEALRHQAVFWRRLGIFSIVSIILSFLMILIMPVIVWLGR